MSQKQSPENSKELSTRIKATPRAIALVGPHGGGKTSLLESIAIITGAIQRKGSVRQSKHYCFAGYAPQTFNPEPKTNQTFTIVLNPNQQ